VVTIVNYSTQRSIVAVGRDPSR